MLGGCSGARDRVSLSFVCWVLAGVCGCCLGTGFGLSAFDGLPCGGLCVRFRFWDFGLLVVWMFWFVGCWFGVGW